MAFAANTDEPEIEIVCLVLIIATGRHFHGNARLDRDNLNYEEF